MPGATSKAPPDTTTPRKTVTWSVTPAIAPRADVRRRRLDDQWRLSGRKTAFNDEPIFELGTGARLIRLQNMIYDNQGADKPGERMLVGSYPERIPNIIPSGSLASVAAAFERSAPSGRSRYAVGAIVALHSPITISGKEHPPDETHSVYLHDHVELVLSTFRGEFLCRS